VANNLALTSQTARPASLSVQSPIPQDQTTLRWVKRPLTSPDHYRLYLLSGVLIQIRDCKLNCVTVWLNIFRESILEFDHKTIQSSFPVFYRYRPVSGSFLNCQKDHFFWPSIGKINALSHKNRMASWMKSPGHRRNLLETRYQHLFLDAELWYASIVVTACKRNS
jgi:hypothetical protein